MDEQDQIATMNERHWEWAVKKGAGCTIPWLDADPALLRLYAKGELSPVPRPYLRMYPANVLAGVMGKDVLCLASGGGQQSVAFGLLGAHVTVLDLTEAQLEGDRRAAAHYGYDVVTIRRDMRDLSRFAAQSFDLVYQGSSMSWVPDVQPIYAGVARILRTGGVYRVDFANPATEFMEPSSWDGEGYRITVPYAEMARIEHPSDGGPDAIQFRHHMADIFNELIAVGLSLRQVQDSPEYFRQDAEARPGSWDHWLRYCGAFAIVAAKR